MKYRVMMDGKPNEDFDTEPEARSVFGKRKAEVSKTKIVNGIRPSCNIHRCYQGKPCEVIERYTK
ncbi:hypothetical protein LCGC14_0931500 [marine sediment metagenome]|uniref:Uncharacterized protein n=1 Tax=marine sediment metagenome TaxID=412755 RepID=A0A0F9R6D0_9ZZZZ